jgi:hypothetical protein
LVQQGQHNRRERWGGNGDGIGSNSIHANLSFRAGDTDDYSSSEVAIMAASVAMKAIR